MIHGDLEDFIRESNRIEGIHRAPTEAEIAAHERVMDTSASAFNVKTLEDFVAVVAPGKKLRERSGMNARIGFGGSGTSVEHRIACIAEAGVERHRERSVPLL